MKKELNIHSQLNPVKKLEVRHESFTGESMTEPGQAYTIQELLANANKGRELVIQGEYDDEPDFDDVTEHREPEADKLTILQMKKDNAEKIEELEKQKKTQLTEKQKSKEASTSESVKNTHSPLADFYSSESGILFCVPPDGPKNVKSSPNHK